MLREGPIPAVIHGMLEYAIGVVLIAAPFVLAFESGEAVAASIVVGVIVLIVAATTAGPTSLVNQVPLAVHVVFDFVLAFFLIAAPFLFVFYEERAPLVFFLVLGVAHLLISIGTRFRPRKEELGSPGASAPAEPASGRRGSKLS